MEPNPDFETEEESEIMATAPVPEISQTSQEIITEKKEIPAETIEISEKDKILPHIKPQENKYWHFTFNTDSNKKQLTDTLQNISGYNGLTVEYGIPQNTPDITLKRNGEIVGKIHLLLCDRRDTKSPEKYYCKIYFYHFKDNQLYQDVKAALINFFENFKPIVEKGGKLNKVIRRYKTHKKRRNIRRKKTSKRN
jgi:hypothetical protein